MPARYVSSQLIKNIQKGKKRIEVECVDQATAWKRPTGFPPASTKEIFSDVADRSPLLLKRRSSKFGLIYPHPHYINKRNILTITPQARWSQQELKLPVPVQLAPINYLITQVAPDQSAQAQSATDPSIRAMSAASSRGTCPRAAQAPHQDRNTHQRNSRKTKKARLLLQIPASGRNSLLFGTKAPRTLSIHIYKPFSASCSR